VGTGDLARPSATICRAAALHEHTPKNLKTIHLERPILACLFRHKNCRHFGTTIQPIHAQDFTAITYELFFTNHVYMCPSRKPQKCSGRNTVENFGPPTGPPTSSVRLLAFQRGGEQ